MRSFWRLTPDAAYVWVCYRRGNCRIRPRARVLASDAPRVSVANVRLWPIADVQQGYRHVRYQEKRSAICFLLFPKTLQNLFAISRESVLGVETFMQLVRSAAHFPSGTGFSNLNCSIAAVMCWATTDWYAAAWEAPPYVCDQCACSYHLTSQWT